MRFAGLAVGTWLLGVAHGLAAPLALVIGNEAYTGMPSLPACGASAGLVARKLTAAGYAVTSAANLSNGGMDGAVGDFAAKAGSAPGTPALIYVCAYGAGLDTRDFVLPVSAQVARPTDLLAEGVLARSFLAAGRGGRKAPLLIALDLVRDPAGVLAPAGGAMAREALPGGTGVLVVAESKPPTAPTALAGALAATASGGALTGDTLGEVAGKLPAGGDSRVAGVQDAKLAAPQAPAAASPVAMAAQIPDDGAMTEADRRRVQIALAGLGYYDGRLDGVFGPDTRAAIRRWQHEKGAEMTGRLTSVQATALAAGK
jgi:peptidoglycan hydrolase-like protein with peptidoglycan-binding domain